MVGVSVDFRGMRWDLVSGFDWLGEKSRVVESSCPNFEIPPSLLQSCLLSCSYLLSLDPTTSNPRDRDPANLDSSPLSDLRDDVDLKPGSSRSTPRPQRSDLPPATLESSTVEPSLTVQTL
ncbi:hypothetical protein CDL15_Pgr011262 [Punica granatum]|uniref:Uncharacterized protein n=1 Tax=Punica granatum TaxID=22663 RepID=A0A218WE90_PUNGR|nr:hypothetical protein CDL15_Pgr011262 [Punica granatum]